MQGLLHILATPINGGASRDRWRLAIVRPVAASNGGNSDAGAERAILTHRKRWSRHHPGAQSGRLQIQSRGDLTGLYLRAQIPLVKQTAESQPSVLGR
jgi:hypothetical protein